VHGLERNPAAERERWLDANTVHRHRQVGAWKAVTVDVCRYVRFPTEGRIDFLPVDVLSTGGRRRRKNSSNKQHSREKSHRFPRFNKGIGPLAPLTQFHV
jgi:hypothetical protein